MTRKTEEYKSPRGDTNPNPETRGEKEIEKIETETERKRERRDPSRGMWFFSLGRGYHSFETETEGYNSPRGDTNSNPGDERRERG